MNDILKAYTYIQLSKTKCILYIYIILNSIKFEIEWNQKKWIVKKNLKKIKEKQYFRKNGWNRLFYNNGHWGQNVNLNKTKMKYKWNNTNTQSE